MANSLGTTLGDNISQSVLDHLVEAMPPLMRFYMGFSDQRAHKDETIKTRIPSVTAAYDASSGYSAKDVTGTDVSVTASNFKATSASFSPAEMSSTNRDLIAEFAAPLASALAEGLLDDFYAIITASAFTNSNVKVAADMDSDTCRLIRKKLSARKAPLIGRLGVLNGDAYEALTGDPLVNSIDSNPAAHDVVSLAPASIVHAGATWFEAPNLPNNSEALNGFVMAPGAIVGATGVPRDANEDGLVGWEDVPRNAAVRVVSDLDEDGQGTGISVLERRTRKEDGSAQIDYAWIYGFAAGNAALLERVTES